MSNTFRTLIIIVMKTTASTGASSGTVIAAEHLPLGRAVGARGLERVARDRRQPAAITTMAKPAQIQM